MAKCVKCNKLVSKKNPGLQCSKCSKWLHAICASISSEQLSTLVSTDSIDWKCRSCVGAGRPKRLSAILPEAEEEEVLTDTEPLGLPNELRNQILADIRREIREIIRDELQRSLKFYSDKIDDFQEKIDDYEDKIQTITHQYNDINNKYKNINLKYEATEQRINLLEQNLIANKLEICDIPRIENENLHEVVTKIAAKINQKPNDVINVYRKGNRSTSTQKSHPSLVVTLRDGKREQWLEAARSNTVTTSDLGLEGESRVYLREALTPATAHLLWKAKNDLKMTNKFKYVWGKRGVVLIKKDDGEKAIQVKSIQDVEKWSRGRE